MKDIYNYEEPYDNVVLTGLVGLYEITFEQSWKMMKEILEIHGFAEGATSSPKMILRTAYKAGMIKDEELWLSALQERNNVTHSYNRKIAMEIITQAKQKFYKMFCELKEEIECPECHNKIELDWDGEDDDCCSGGCCGCGHHDECGSDEEDSDTDNEEKNDNDDDM